MMWDHMDINGWWTVWLTIMMIVFWGGLIALLVWGVRTVSGDKHPDSPMDIAGRRYASGEITRQQYEELRGALVKPAHGPGGSPA